MIIIIMIMELPETDSTSSIECSICRTTKILTYRAIGDRKEDLFRDTSGD
jgi:hypothetical protein